MTTTDDAAWMIRHHDGQVHGPYSLQALVDAAHAGNIAEDSQVNHSTHTRGQWIAANRVRPIAAAMQTRKTISHPINDSNREPDPIDRGENDPPGVAVQTEEHPRRRRTDFRSNVPTTLLNACWGLIDFRFRTFVTPWIIRIYWGFAVVVTALSLIFGAATVVTYPVRSMMPEFSSGSPSFSAPGYRSSDSSKGFQIPKKVGKFAALILGYFVKVVLAIMFLITIRLMLEFGIVVFNIAEDIRSIRDQTV